ncbi:MED20 [Lepeophtheirus salmonis]|uniref:Mediator of RNA polymerase II transcription subunit 20 n=1 Tax=Lepeophtheirus salmonis TaxID=72036 RepID=A0A7R8CCV8_LEPSM|nr:MED20 [Lepeophtheirus salmonis]CAF2775128.1 MED20 [Lepeophtheirus salmonis]
MSTSGAPSILAAKETFSTLLEISKLLNTGLDAETLAICVRLCENGANPDSLATDKTAPQTIDLIQKRILNLGAVHTGQFLVDCETYINTTVPSKVLHVLHNSEQPATVFSILESPGKHSVSFTSDTLFDLLLLKLSNIYSKKSKIESKGHRFEIGDFLVKLGVVSSAGSFKGILIEVEYLPCSVISSSWNLIVEFMQGFLGSTVPTEIPSCIKSKESPGEMFSPLDTIQLYLEHFGNLRKVTTNLAAGPQMTGTSVSSTAPSSSSSSSLTTSQLRPQTTSSPKVQVSHAKANNILESEFYLLNLNVEVLVLPMAWKAVNDSTYECLSFKSTLFDCVIMKKDRT